MRRLGVLFTAVAITVCTTLFGASAPALADEGAACNQTIVDDTTAKLLAPHTEQLLAGTKSLKDRGAHVRIIAVQDIPTDDIKSVINTYIAQCTNWQTQNDGKTVLNSKTLVIVWTAAVNEDDSQQRIGLYSGSGLDGLDNKTLKDIRLKITPVLLQYTPKDTASSRFVADGIGQALELANGAMAEARFWFWIWVVVAVAFVLLVVIAIVIFTPARSGGKGGSGSGYAFVGGSDGGGGSSSPTGTDGAC